jgi:prepilin-type N-terminal cleavage/methylation domain-containing protein
MGPRASGSPRHRLPSSVISPKGGFTLLELIIVIFLITLLLGMSAIFFAGLLPSNRFNATVRNISSAMKSSRSLAQIHGRPHVFTINLDAKKYGIDGHSAKDIPDDMNIKVVDPMSGELYTGSYQFVMHPAGNIEGGTIVLWNTKKTATIQLDPVVGAIVIK